MSKNCLRKSIHHKLHRDLRDILINTRKDLGLSQRDFAKQLGVTYSIIGKIETGDRRLDVVEFYEYTKALNNSVNMIYTSFRCNNQYTQKPLQPNLL